MQLRWLKEEIDERENWRSQPLDEAGGRKVMGRAVGSILKNMLKLLDVSHDQGFVYYSRERETNQCIF